MRVALVGPRHARARLRADLATASIDIVAEYSTLTQARAADIDVEAFVLAPGIRHDSRDRERPRRLRLEPDPEALRRAPLQPDRGDPRGVRLQPARGDSRGVRLQPDFQDDDAPTETLTRREIEVLELLAAGLPNKAIASRLGISDQTVKFHVGSISGKLGASNRTDAVRRAVRRGLLTL